VELSLPISCLLRFGRWSRSIRMRK